MGKDVIVACDFSSAEQTFAFLDKFTGKKPFVKIGMELYYAEGPEIVRQIKARGHKIFLDLKLHDIPNTVKKAMAVLSNLDVDITNLHAAGTTAMMQGALEGLTRPDGSRPLLIAVTQLTSTDQETMERDILIKEDAENVDGLNFLAGKPLSYVNEKAFEGTILAHNDGGVPNIVIENERMDETSLGYLIYFFEKACAVSGYVLGVNPFDQPGVESYKKNMFALLGKPGYEKEKEALEQRLNK